MPGDLAARLRPLLHAGVPVAHVVVAEARGSTPREAGAAMLVTAAETFGTIGGGRMEWDAVARARSLLVGGEAQATLDIPLGPAIGQCCGGHVRLQIARADAATLAGIVADARQAEAARPAVLLFGAGHVGRALAWALSPLPLTIHWMDGRPEAFEPEIPPGVIPIVSTAWEQSIQAAPAGTACLVLTHSHALDSLIVEAALKRDDFCYVGLIGSRSKRARFERGFRDIGIPEAAIAHLTCPIGAGFPRDKRPEVIAAFAAAELLQASLLWHSEPDLQRSRLSPLAANAAV